MVTKIIKWCLAIILATFILLFVFGIFINFIVYFC